MTESRVVLVSGGSRGLGLATAARLLERGHAVAAFARHGTPESGALAAGYGARFLFREIDARNPGDLDAFVEEAAGALGPVWGLVNNAAVGQDHLFTHLPIEKVDEILAVNLRGTIVLTRAVVRAMIRQGAGGRIVNVSSICGQRGYAGLSVYSATKGALDALTRALARELGARDILVNAVAPGFFESEMSRLLRADQIDAIRRRTPTGRLVEPPEVIALIEMLLFDNSNVTGQVLLVDGGASA